MTNTRVTCPGCGDRFLVPVTALEDELGLPVPESEIEQMHDCRDERGTDRDV